MQEESQSYNVIELEDEEDTILITPQGVGPGHPVHDALIAFMESEWAADYEIEEFTMDDTGADLASDMLNDWLVSQDVLDEAEIIDQGGAVILGMSKVMMPSCIVLALTVGFFPDTLDSEPDEDADDESHWGH